MSFERLKSLDLSRDEMERLAEALKKEEFRKLLVDYVEEVQNPANRKIFQEEIIQLEKERGFDAHFVNPEPGFVLKSSIDGTKKCFINICMADCVAKPSVRGGSGSVGGVHLQLPHSMSPPRNDVDKNNKPCTVFDVVFHPSVMKMVRMNKAVSKLVNKTALDSVEKNFNVLIDRNNIRFPKISYKGHPTASIVRKPSQCSTASDMDEFQKKMFDEVYPPFESKTKKSEDKPHRMKKTQRNEQCTSTPSPCEGFTIPKYVIKYRNHVDWQEFTNDKSAKIHSAIPNELSVEIALPLLRSSNEVTLDVTEKQLSLKSSHSSKYKLDLTLPYPVYEREGNAKFERDTKRLTITLPVKRSSYKLPISELDSGVDSDVERFCGSGCNNTLVESIKCDSPLSQSVKEPVEDCLPLPSFLDSSNHYTLPDITSNIFQNRVAFTLMITHALRDSVKLIVLPKQNALHLKALSLSAGYYATHYACFLKFHRNDVKIENETFPVDVDISDENIVLRLVMDNIPEKYFYGVCDQGVIEKNVKENIGIIDKLNESNEEVCCDNQSAKLPLKECSVANITSCCTTSSTKCEHTHSNNGGGILKIPIDGRDYYDYEKGAESSADEFTSSGESISSSLKKTVRFNDVIRHQLYRSNSSILGQRKKNQRKARNKKRAHDRKNSGSESESMLLSSSRKGDTAGIIGNGNSGTIHANDISNVENGIFQLDMN